MATKRIRLGSRADMSSRSQVYLGAEGVEVDEYTGFAGGRRRRVLFDEVQMVTLDRRRNKVSIFIASGMAMFMLAIWTIVLSTTKQGDNNALLITLIFLIGPFLLYIAGHLAIGVDVITVFGKRSIAQLTFSFRKERAREVYGMICTEVEAHTVQDPQVSAAAEAS